MDKQVIFGIKISNRMKNVPHMQTILSEFGCNIKTRLGLHDVSETSCSPNGLLILELHGEEESIIAMEAKLREVPGIDIQKMVFDK
ncbi:hypothetical protein [uncultured Desulfobulbus sp.]|uniref:hypothetical protein n=1 Tax=uncultured Desulfobulbus sp. TaxID=239745 RepID=UPI0029C7E850|nr:hypothetical protein [uncultured Desulfobulbus sp.]